MAACGAATCVGCRAVGLPLPGWRFCFTVAGGWWGLAVTFARPPLPVSLARRGSTVVAVRLSYFSSLSCGHARRDVLVALACRGASRLSACGCCCAFCFGRDGPAFPSFARPAVRSVLTVGCRSTPLPPAFVFLFCVWLLCLADGQAWADLPPPLLPLALPTGEPVSCTRPGPVLRVPLSPAVGRVTGRACPSPARPALHPWHTSFPLVARPPKTNQDGARRLRRCFLCGRRGPAGHLRLGARIHFHR